MNVLNNNVNATNSFNTISNQNNNVTGNKIEFSNDEDGYIEYQVSRIF